MPVGAFDGIDEAAADVDAKEVDGPLLVWALLVCGVDRDEEEAAGGRFLLFRAAI